MSAPRRPISWVRIGKALGIVAAVVLVFGAGLLVSRYLDDRPRSQASSCPESRYPRSRVAGHPVLRDELRPFLTKYGKPLYSSHHEELFVRDFFHDRRDGYFVDVGASHYRDRSNTYYLEAELGWRGLAIDPIADFAEGYRQHRPNTKFFVMFVSDRSDERARLFIGDNSLFSSSEKAFTAGYTHVQRTVEVPTITLDDLLNAEKIDHIDFLSIDVELHEPQVLGGFSIERFAPALVCVEAHPQVRQQILDYFEAHDYVVAADYLRADPQNLWFKPAGH